jgi:putative nucleotidyltransferase with HDIG domain
MSKGLNDLIPEFDEIQNGELKQRVLDVWLDALEVGGWTVDELARVPSSFQSASIDIPLVEHVSAVTRLCVAMEAMLKQRHGDRYDIDHDTLVAGALLHDVGKLLDVCETDGTYKPGRMHQYLRHPFSGVMLCSKQGIPDAVMHIVATHSWEGENFRRQAEAIILHHADFVEYELALLK